MTQDDNFDEVKINNNIFNLLHFKVSDKSLKNNRLYLCANNRLIASINLQNHIIDLDEQIYELNNFWYIGILTGSYLDENVDMTRLSFLFPNDSTDIFYSISLTNIIETCQIHIEQYLSSYLVKIIDDKKSKINKFILTNVQQFRHLLTYMSDKVYKIKPKSTNAQIEEHLYHIDHLYRSETKQNIDKLINDLDFFSSDYEQCFNTTLQQINDINRDLLVEYVTHRKFIIKLLEKGIMGTDDGNYQKENYLHQLIYPMKNTSDDLDYDSHNLWLIDDKLSYCRLIYSDSPFNNGSKQVRPDLTILDHPVAVSDDPNEGKSFDTIIIFEIKRPMRNEYNDLNNPIDQLYNYVIKFRSNTLIDIHKRPIHVNESTKFFLYAICDITDNLKTYIDKYDFVESTDKLGFFTYNKKYNAYFEILSYDKLLNDAKKRNRVFFDKLGI
jgi:hypothetical protein